MRSLSRFAPFDWLLATTVIVVASFVGATLYSGQVAGHIDGMAEDIASNADPSIRYLGTVRTELHAMYNLLNLAIFGLGPISSLTRELEAHAQRLDKNIVKYTSLPFFPTEYERWRATDQCLRNAELKMSAVAAKLESRDVSGAQALHVGALASAVERADLELEQLIGFDADQGSRLSAEITSARRTAVHASYLLNAMAVVLATVMLGVGGKASSRYVSALREAREAEEQLTKKLEAVASAALSVVQKLPYSQSLADLLQTTVDTAKVVAGADMAALGVGTDPSQPFDPFVYSGMDPSWLERSGPPRPACVFSAVIKRERTLRIADLGEDRRFDLSKRYPPIGPFLGMAVRHEQDAAGYLFLGKQPGAAPFSEQDVHAVELLATFSAVAVQNANLYAEVRRQVAAREDVLAMVSHDLRSPLSAITLTAGLLGKNAGPDAEVRQFVERIARNASRMERMIGDLLTAARLREGRLTIEPKLQAIAPLVAEAVEPFVSEASKKGVQLRVELAQPLCPLFCDGGRIVQVLSNLAGNALKFTGRGGSIVISARVCDTPRSEVLFSVRDTGVGIAEDVLPRVFDRYWQKKEDTSQGNGLGLFIAKGIVDAHHGRIWVTSHVGKGSDFQFTIPVSEGSTDSS